MKDEVKCSGQVLVETLNEVGEVVDTQHLTNKVVEGGRAYIAALLAGEGLAAMDYIAIGSSNSGTIDTHSTLIAETARVRIDARYRSGQQVVFQAYFPAGVGSGTVGEIGIFNTSGANAGVMLARVTYSQAQPKESTTTVRVTWTISLV